MTLKPVVCGVDGSSSRKAIELARDVGRHTGAPVLYVHVVDGIGSERRAARTLAETGADGTLHVEHGHPADRLVALAGERGAALLVVGNHGPRSSLLGSISADVARRAPCPVVVVPPTVEIAPRNGRSAAAYGPADPKVVGSTHCRPVRVPRP
jgi:nucleotide-binding universal stress UspA family protein